MVWVVVKAGALGGEGGYVLLDLRHEWLER